MSTSKTFDFGGVLKVEKIYIKIKNLFILK